MKHYDLAAFGGGFAGVVGTLTSARSGANVPLGELSFYSRIRDFCLCMELLTISRLYSII